jgi:hypothetical protein
VTVIARPYIHQFVVGLACALRISVSAIGRWRTDSRCMRSSVRSPRSICQFAVSWGVMLGSFRGPAALALNAYTGRARGDYPFIERDTSASSRSVLRRGTWSIGSRGSGASEMQNMRNAIFTFL